MLLSLRTCDCELALSLSRRTFGSICRSYPLLSRLTHLGRLYSSSCTFELENLNGTRLEGCWITPGATLTLPAKLFLS